jgi:poly(3-hydroxybutyrate) depolymerase
MKKFILLITIFRLSLASSFCENPTLKTIQAGGFERQYMVYTPQNSQYVKPAGIIVCLHGFGRTMNDFFDEYNVTAVADSLNLIIAAPQALPEQNSTVISEAGVINSFTSNQISLQSVWGCGLSVKASSFGISLLNEELNRDVDDVDFINQMIDSVLCEYSLSLENIFMLGTSMGGYMTYQYALEKGDRLSGIISVAGSMGLAIKDMDYTTKVPVCDFHSLTDEVVPYSGSYTTITSDIPVTITLGMNMQDVIDYWVETNGAGAPDSTAVQNYPSTNEITVEKFTYPDPVNEVIHYKINGASHSYFFRKENGDCMDYPEEISRFIRSHLSSSPTPIPDITAEKTFFYPNPVQDIINFDIMSGNASVYDITGRKLFSQSFLSGQADLSFLKPGIYIIRVQSENAIQIGRFVKQ